MADPDLQTKGRGGGAVIQTLRLRGVGGGGAQKKYFSAHRASFWYKCEGGWTLSALPLDPPLTPDRVCVKFQGVGGYDKILRNVGLKQKFPPLVWQWENGYFQALF